jgi:putative hydrolase of the HAD superfamily
MWVFCDLDGTLLDSLGVLRAVYDAFVRDYGGQPDDAEFAALNGPALPEIVARLRAAHRMQPPESALLSDYRRRLLAAYAEAPACAGADDLLAQLARSGHRCGLVTSSPRDLVAAVCAARGWSFAVQVCGDEVTHAKPAPDLYYLALQRAGIQADHAIAIEDSRHGVAAAAAAGLRVLGVHGVSPDAAGLTAYAGDLFSVAARICTRLLAEGSLRIVVCADPHPADVLHAQDIAVAWDEARRTNPRLHDGTLLCLESWCRNGLGIQINAQWRPYRSYVARRRCSDLPLHLSPIGVTGLTWVGDRVLVGRRAAHVTAYPEAWETVPAGSIDRHDSTEGTIDPGVPLLCELVEETGLTVGDVRRVVCLGLVYDPVDDVYDIAVRLEVDAPPDWTPCSSSEHSELRLISLAEAAELDPVVPTLAVLLDHIRTPESPHGRMRLL